MTQSPPDGATLSAIKSFSLVGADVTTYVRRFEAVLRAARLNSFFPDSRRLGAHVGAMSPERHGGLYEALQINAHSGLPTYREWTRVQTDVTIAADQLSQLGSRATLEARTRQSASEIHAKQLAKYDYYQALLNLPLAPLDAMQVALRRVDAGAGRAYFHVVFDKLDASGTFVRYSIDLSQQSTVWSTPAVVLDDETARHTDAFKALIYKFSSLDAEFTFAKLVTMPGVDVERVVKGTVGPLYFDGVEVPEPLAGLFARSGEGSGARPGSGSTAVLASFALDTAARDVAEDRDNDPLGELYTDGVSERLRATYAKARQAYGYRVFKDRKFVASRELVAPLRELCAAAGTQNIIYSL